MLRRVFKAFEYREFRLLWIGACTSSIGTWMQVVAQSWLVLQLSNSPFLLGLDSFFGQAPIVLFSLVGGVIADRRDRRQMLIGSQLIQLTCAFLLAILISQFQVHVWEILTLSVFVGLAQSFGGPAYQALIPTLVEGKDLPNAIALNSIQFNLARVIGPVLGGFAFARLGAAWCFSLNGVSYIAVIISLLLLRKQAIPAKDGTSLLASMGEGLNFVRHREAMAPLIVIAFLMTGLGIPILTFLPVVVKNVFHMDAQVFTNLLGLSGAGAVSGALIVAGLSNIAHRGKVALTVLILLGALIVAFGWSNSIYLSGALLFFAGAALIAAFAMISSLVQMIVPDEMRGRVMSVYNVAFRGGMPLGSLISGALIKYIGVQAVLSLNGACLVLVGAYFLLFQRKVAQV